MTAVFAYIHDRWIKWPPTIGIMAIALISSLVIAVSGYLVPQISSEALVLVSNINFEQVLMRINTELFVICGHSHISMQINSVKKKNGR